MTDKAFEPTALIESFRSAFAPVLNAQIEGLKTLDRFAHYQYAVAGDYLEYSLAQAKAGLGAKTPNELWAKHSELGTRLAEQLRARAQEFGSIATETQALVNQFFTETTAKVTELSKKAA